MTQVIRALIFRLLALGAVLGAIPALAAPYMNLRGCRFTPPADWRLLTAAGPALGRVSVFAAPAQYRFAANVSFVTASAPPGTTAPPSALLTMLGEKVNTAYPEQFTHYTRLSEAMTKVAWSPALNLTAKYQTGKPPRLVRVHQVYLLRNHVFYLFTLTSLPQNYSQNDAAFASMLHHVYWTN